MTGTGSTFWAEIPLEICGETERPPIPEFARKRQILVVDDLEDARLPIVDMLLSFGLEASAVSSGELALDLILQAEAGEHPFDLLLLDWRMPGLDGLATARRIRELPLKQMPSQILVTSGFVDTESEEISASGIVSVLNKPVTPSALHDLFINLLRPEPHDASAPALSNPISALARLGNATLLVVEDNPVNQEVACYLLKAAGLAVETVSDGIIALEMAQQKLYTIIFMDVQMPRMDGMEATRRIRMLPE